MSKRILSLLAILAAANACSDEITDSASSEDFSNHSSAISMRNFDVIGGQPWDRTAKLAPPSDVADAKNYGTNLVLGDINGDAKADIITAFKTPSGSGRIDINFGTSHTILWMNPKLENALDDFGTAMAIGDYCPEINAKGKILVVSAPNYANGSGSFGLIYRTSALKVQKRLTHQGVEEHAGKHFTIGDFDGDGKNDLIYQLQPEGKSAKIAYASDFCNGASSLISEDINVTEASSKSSQIGDAMLIADLNGNNANELILSDPDGRYIAFYHKALNLAPVKSRNSLKLPGKVLSMEVADLNGDGLKDLIVALIDDANPGGHIVAYKNNGQAKDFSQSKKLWEMKAESDHAQFGQSMKIADLNGDNVPDLIVGAPGENDAHGKIYVMMGTADGSIFSKPYWQSASKSSYSALGNTIDVAKLSANDGWLDIATGSPSSDGGFVSVFYQDTKPCYTADKCLIDDKCYAKDQSSPGSSCQYCDPKQNNFDFSAVVCPKSPDPCSETGTCHENKGCVYEKTPDGTICSVPQCNKNVLSASYCKSGTCTPATQNCGLYVCQSDMSECPNTCQSDKDCTTNNICRLSLNRCIPKSENHPPIVAAFIQANGQKPSAHINIKPGDIVTFDLSQSYDPDFDPLTYKTTCIKRETNKSVLSVALPNFSSNKFTELGEYVCTAYVHDGHVSSSPKTLYITVDDPNNQIPKAVIELISGIQSGREVFIHPGDIVTLNGSKSYDPDGDKLIHYKWEIRKNNYQNVLYKPVETWTAPGPGEYEVLLFVTDEKNATSYGSSAQIHVSIENNEPPVIRATVSNGVNTGTQIHAHIGETLVFDASNSYDPDGDPLTFKWYGWDLEATTPIATTPVYNEIMPENSYLGYTLTVTDSAGNEATTELLVSVQGNPPTNKNPIAVIDNYTGKAGQSITLDASKSRDPDGDKLYFQWLGQAVSNLSDPRSSTPSFIIPKTAKLGDIFTLTLNVLDGKGGIASKTVTITVTGSTEPEPPSKNHAPVAVLPQTLSVIVENTIVVDASQSYDPDNDPLTYRWSVSGKCTLNKKTGAVIEVTAPGQASFNETCKLKLTVSDPYDASDTASATIYIAQSPYYGHDLYILTPDFDATVNSPVTIAGGFVFGSKNPIDVYNADTGELICTHNSGKEFPYDGAIYTWGCSASLPPGTYRVFASANGEITSNDTRFHVALNPDYDLTITYPKQGSKTSVYPKVSGTTNAPCTQVRIYSAKSEDDDWQVLCTADVKDETWSCRPKTALEHETKYKLHAECLMGTNASIVTNDVYFVTEAKSPDKPDPDKPDPYKPDPDKPDPDKPDPDKPDPDKPDPDKPDPDKPDPDKPDPDKPDPDKPDPDKPDPDKPDPDTPDPDEPNPDDFFGDVRGGSCSLAPNAPAATGWFLFALPAFLVLRRRREHR